MNNGNTYKRYLNFFLFEKIISYKDYTEINLLQLKNLIKIHNQHLYDTRQAKYNIEVING